MKLFKERTQCVIDQYSKYEVPGGQKLNGANTVGENIADIGGVKLALAGYRALRSSAPETVVADGFTEDQQFFLSFGQAWCAKMRPGLREADGDGQRALACEVARRWRALGDAGVLEGVPLQGRREDAAGEVSASSGELVAGSRRCSLIAITRAVGSALPSTLAIISPSGRRGLRLSISA